MKVVPDFDDASPKVTRFNALFSSQCWYLTRSVAVVLSMRLVRARYVTLMVAASVSMLPYESTEVDEEK